MHTHSESAERLLGKPEILGLLAISRTQLWRLIRAGRFPEPIRLGHRTVRWRERDVATWLDAA